MSGDPFRPGDVVRIRDERWRVSRIVPHAGACAVIEVQGSDRSNRDARTRFVLPFEHVERLRTSQTMQVVRPARWRHLARRTLADLSPPYDALRAAPRAGISILPFQLEPALALIRGLASRILIADEVGLGKTIQAGLIISELLDRLDQPHVLVVVPATLRDQWREELRQRFQVEASIFDSVSLARMDAGPASSATPWLLHPVIVTSIDYIKRPEALRGLETTVWDLVVFDEAHALATRSDRHAAATAIAERARHVVMLTATPHSGHDQEFARLCGVGDLDGRFPLLAFRRTRAEAGLQTIRRTTWLKVTPTAAERQMHDALLAYLRLIWSQKGASSADARLAAMVLARRGSSSATSLATSLERRLALMTGERIDSFQMTLPWEDAGASRDEAPAAELGARGLHDADAERRHLIALLELARAAQLAESKLRTVRRFLRRAAEPAIVFTEYRDTLARLASELRDLDPVIVHGGIASPERRAALRDFTTGRTRLLLATDAVSEGLNLHHHCRLVINLELPWTPRRLEQRVGRVERIGQKRAVHEVHVMAAGTFEGTTLAALRRRTDRARDVDTALRGSPAREEDVARAVLGEGSPEPSSSPSIPAGVFLMNLREVSTHEAQRILQRRRLDADGACDDTRPFVCARRTPGSPPGAYWGFRLEFLDGDSQVLWDTLVALHFPLAPPPLRCTGDVRDLANRLRRALAATVTHEHLAAADAMRRSISVPCALALDREQAIEAAARRQHARMAARFVQPALFDRRVERQAADQRAALADLLSRCQLRCDLLRRWQQLTAGSLAPAFALIRFR